MPRESLVEDIEAEHLRARIAWFYFVGGMTQQEIADLLNVTRLRVNKTIGQVRSEGSVQVDLKLPMANCIELEQALKVKYGLLDVVVVPTFPDYVQTQQVIGEAAGVMLGNLLPGKKGIGVGWGRTLSFSVRRLGGNKFDAKKAEDYWVVGLMGGVSRGSGTNTFEVSTAVSQAINAECYYLTAPIYCQNEESREVLFRNEELIDVMQKADEAEIAIVSCGDLSELSPMPKIALVRESLSGLIAKGAVGEVLGCFLNAQGGIVDHPLNRSIMALPLEKLKRKGTTILASGGVNKQHIIHGILHAGYVNRLVTDEDVAMRLTAA